MTTTPTHVDPIEDALATFDARFVAGAPSAQAARDALDALRSFLAAAEHEMGQTYPDGVPAALVAPELPLGLCEAGCGLPTAHRTGVCPVCTEAVLRNGETMEHAAIRLAAGDITIHEWARLPGRPERLLLAVS